MVRPGVWSLWWGLVYRHYGEKRAAVIGIVFCVKIVICVCVCVCVCGLVYRHYGVAWCIVIVVRPGVSPIWWEEGRCAWYSILGNKSDVCVCVRVCVRPGVTSLWCIAIMVYRHYGEAWCMVIVVRPGVSPLWWEEGRCVWYCILGNKSDSGVWVTFDYNASVRPMLLLRIGRSRGSCHYYLKTPGISLLS